MSRNLRIQLIAAITILAGFVAAKPASASETGCYACVSSCGLTQQQNAAECDEQCGSHGFSMPCSETLFCIVTQYHIKCT